MVQCCNVGAWLPWCIALCQIPLIVMGDLLNMWASYKWVILIPYQSWLPIYSQIIPYIMVSEWREDISNVGLRVQLNFAQLVIDHIWHPTPVINISFIPFPPYNPIWSFKWPLPIGGLHNVLMVPCWGWAHIYKIINCWS